MRSWSLCRQIGSFSQRKQIAIGLLSYCGEKWICAQLQRPILPRLRKIHDAGKRLSDPATSLIEHILQNIVIHFVRHMLFPSAFALETNLHQLEYCYLHPSLSLLDKYEGKMQSLYAT